jgi:hypothetical protein
MPIRSIIVDPLFWWLRNVYTGEILVVAKSKCAPEQGPKKLVLQSNVLRFGFASVLGVPIEIYLYVLLTSSILADTRAAYKAGRLDSDMLSNDWEE